MSKCKFCGNVHNFNNGSKIKGSTSYYATGYYNSISAIDFVALYPSAYSIPYKIKYLEKEKKYSFNADYDGDFFNEAVNIFVKFKNGRKKKHVGDSLEYDFMRFDNKIYIKAELFEYIKIMFDEGKIDFWDLFHLQEIHNFLLINSENEKKAEPSDKVILQITI